MHLRSVYKDDLCAQEGRGRGRATAWEPRGEEEESQSGKSFLSFQKCRNFDRTGTDEEEGVKEKP